MKIKITFANEVMDLENALISGRLEDGSPTSCYIGVMDLDELHSYLYFTHRAVIKLLVNQLGVPFGEVDSFLVSALSEAVVKEYNEKARGESDMDVKASMMFRKNQK
jgi:hypothetical protein